MPKHSMAQHGPHFHQRCRIPQAPSMLVCIACACLAVDAASLRPATLLCCVSSSRLPTTLVHRYPGEQLCSTARCAACTSTPTQSPGAHAALRCLCASAHLLAKWLSLPFILPFHSCAPLHFQTHVSCYAQYLWLLVLTPLQTPAGHAETSWRPLAQPIRPPTPQR